MGLFGNPRKKIEKWAPIVMEDYTPGMPVEEAFLDAATMLYIKQHAQGEMLDIFSGKKK